MRRIISILISLCLLLVTVSCGKQSESESKPKLSEWQTELLEAKGLPTEYDNLTSEQKHFIDRVGEIIDYLNQKYDEEFIYYDYKPAELMDSEKLYAYPKSTGIGNGKYLVTVKARNGGFEDDYHDFSVGELAEELINDWIHSYLGTDDYRYYSRVNACNIKMSEIENENFQWKYGASNIIFIKMDKYDFDELEKFAVNYAKFLYEHQISGTHRINVMNDWPDYKVNYNNCDKLYHEQKYIGFYCLGFINNKRTVITDSCRVEVNEKGRSDCFDRKSEDYSIDEYFSKYN